MKITHIDPIAAIPRKPPAKGLDLLHELPEEWDGLIYTTRAAIEYCQALVHVRRNFASRFLMGIPPNQKIDMAKSVLKNRFGLFGIASR